MKIVLTGGGTGGHAYPAVSIGRAIRAESPACELLYIGSRGGMEQDMAEKAGIRFVGLTSRKMGRALSFGTFLTAASLARGFLEASAALRRFKPDLVIGTGGYVAAAVVMAQAMRRGKTLIHEQNVVPGRTNSMLARFVSRICVSFDQAAAHFPEGKSVVTGLPVRPEILDRPDRASARERLRLNPDRFTLLVFGGSQGARSLNRAVADALPRLRKLPIQVFHQAGTKNFHEALNVKKAAEWSGYHLHSYVDDMAAAYAAADMVVCRSGASTVCEVTIVGLPAVFVPYPFAITDEQRRNAHYVADRGGALVIEDSDLTGDALADCVERFLNSPDELAEMAEASRKLGRPDAAREVVRVAVELITAK
ncbi:MAG: undecaprenyldiphospho-muramoylpentapeptide beta-N-acetylglucosaminyltransferase [Armatimonadetes bacterium]|nr:undecaprenyldiphospho-muramoylpentapeptide beta-N-acetylglucosaminyltransferase [Armatimonadota bacterium]